MRDSTIALLQLQGINKAYGPLSWRSFMLIVTTLLRRSAEYQVAGYLVAPATGILLRAEENIGELSMRRSSMALGSWTLWCGYNQGTTGLVDDVRVFFAYIPISINRKDWLGLRRRAGADVYL